MIQIYSEKGFPPFLASWNTNWKVFQEEINRKKDRERAMEEIERREENMRGEMKENK